MTSRFIPRSVECLRPFVEAGLLGMVEVHVVATLVETADPACPAVDPDVILAAALAVRAPLHGHVRVDLAEVASTAVPDESPGLSFDGGSDLVTADSDPDHREPDTDRDDEGSLPGPLDPSWFAEEGSAPALAGDGVVWPDPSRWIPALLASPLARESSVDRGTDVVPLVVAGTSVYLDRLWCDEMAVAEDLRARAGAASEVPEHRIVALDRYLPESSDGVPDRQRAAVLAALGRQLVVIAGGPGTGKTRTVARLLAVLATPTSDASTPDPEEGSRTDQPLEIALAAPTGKAAARLAEAITAAIREAEPGDALAGRLGALEARTVHRLLGARRGGASFLHDSSEPLTADVVVIDEVSMVSLPLMARLLDAVRPDARVVLVGDPHQLASVEAGAVLGDLVGRGSDGPPSVLQDNVVVLDRVFRFGAGSPVGRLAAAIKDGDSDSAIAVLRSAGGAADGGVSLIDPGAGGPVAAVRARVLDHAARLVDDARAARADDVLSSLGGLGVLCATRRGPLGVEDWNRWIEGELRATGRMRMPWSSGRPVMVSANDLVNGVFNGDVGVVVRRNASARGPGSVRVAFDGPTGPRLLDPSRLDRIVTQWAMTIHKSQGSEFTDVVVTLPPPPSPMLTRELLYTAVTRARSGVTLIASEGSVRAAIGRPVARASGLGDRLS